MADKSNPDPFWIEYRNTLLLSFFEPQNVADYISHTIPPPSVLLEPIAQTENIKEAVDLMRNLVTEEKIEQLRVRFRSYKYRKSKDKKTLQINSVTHQKILDFTKDLEVETVDEALDYLCSRKYATEVEEAAKSHGELTYEGDELYLESLLRRLGKRDRERVLLACERSFMDGWSAAKRSRSHKHDARLTATEQYLKDYEKYR